eukprot:326189-Amphidinium_carterae.1
MPQATRAASSSLHPASAVIPDTTHLGTLLDDTQSASADHTSSQAASAAHEYGPNEAAHMRMCACPGKLISWHMPMILFRCCIQRLLRQRGNCGRLSWLVTT